MFLISKNKSLAEQFYDSMKHVCSFHFLGVSYNQAYVPLVEDFLDQNINTEG